jgi:hypothetical protein
MARHDIDPKQVYVLPSGKYASYVPASAKFERGEAVVQVAMLSYEGEWHPTPARHLTATLLGLDGYSSHPGKPFTGRLAIDYGQGWILDEADTAAHVAFAAGVHRMHANDPVPGTFSRITDDYRARF